MIKILEIGLELIDKLFPDPVEKTKAQAQLIELEQKGELSVLKSRYQAIVAEAQSDDRWTSRARPSFLYVFYLVIAVLVLITPCIGIWYPEQMTQFYLNVGAGFKAIPEEMWWTFSAGYLGYTTAREYGKHKKAKVIGQRE